MTRNLVRLPRPGKDEESDENYCLWTVSHELEQFAETGTKTKNAVGQGWGGVLWWWGLPYRVIMLPRRRVTQNIARRLFISDWQPWRLNTRYTGKAVKFQLLLLSMHLFLFSGCVFVCLQLPFLGVELYFAFLFCPNNGWVSTEMDGDPDPVRGGGKHRPHFSHNNLSKVVSIELSSTVFSSPIRVGKIIHQIIKCSVEIINVSTSLAVSHYCNKKRKHRKNWESCPT